jgi:nucleoside-diphosphate-sugar epimerase
VDYYARQNNFRSCIFRLANVYAPRSENTSPGFVGAFAESINTGERIRLPGGGSPIRDLLHVDDLSAACTAFHDSIIKHGTYNLGGGRENSISLRGLIERMESVSGLQAVIDEENPLPEPVPRRYISDLSLIRQELDWEPKIGLDEGLATLFRQ